MARSASTSTAFSRRVVRAVERLRDQRRLSNTELIRAAGLSSNYFYIRLRGESPFNTNDIEKLAIALDVKPYEILRLAQSSDLDGDADDEWTERLDGAELARRLVFLARAPTGPEARAFAVDALEGFMQQRGIEFDDTSWPVLVAQTGAVRMASRQLDALAEYFGVDSTYLRSTRDRDTAQQVEAEVELYRALVDTGATAVSARALGGMSAAQLQAITRAIRSIEKDPTNGESSS